MEINNYGNTVWIDYHVTYLHTDSYLATNQLCYFSVRKQERAKERKLRVHEKSTYASRVDAKMASLRQTVLALNKPDSSEPQGGSDKATRLHKDTQFVLATTRGNFTKRL